MIYDIYENIYSSKWTHGNKLSKLPNSYTHFKLKKCVGKIKNQNERD